LRTLVGAFVGALTGAVSGPAAGLATGLATGTLPPQVEGHLRLLESQGRGGGRGPGVLAARVRFPCLGPHGWAGLTRPDLERVMAGRRRHRRRHCGGWLLRRAHLG
ncbi:MAG: hypothetical protein ACRDPT_10120, partial [Streptomycetales bacterium]